MKTWIKGNKILRELQNEFRSGRRLDDILSVLTQGIEIASVENESYKKGYKERLQGYKKKTLR